MSKDLAKPKGLVIIIILWVVQSADRFYFAIAGFPGGMGQFLDVPVSYETSVVLFTMFLSLGVLGLIAVSALLMKRRWSFWMIVLVSVATIVFDTWDVTIQGSTAIGFIVPVVSLIYLGLNRNFSC
ncbi:MAG: hypothetical protein ACUVQ0_02280 [Thermoproteota archaeon]